jgi:hypothetical protein
MSLKKDHIVMQPIYRNTPLNLPGATISSPPGPAGHRTPYGLLRVAHEKIYLEA